MKAKDYEKILPCLYKKHGRYWLVKRGKWMDFGTDEYEARIKHANWHKPKKKGGMDDLLDAYLEGLDVAASTLEGYKSAIESKIKPAFANFHPEDVLETDVAAFLYHYKKTPGMANKMRVILRGAFNLAIEQGITKSNPAFATKRNKTKPRKRFLEDSEYLAIHAQAEPMLQAIMEMAYYTSQRINDVLKMRVSDIRKDVIYVKPKKTERQGKEILIEITPELRQVINYANSIGNVRSMFVFNQRNGKPWSYQAIRRRFAAAAKAAGIADTRLHDLRAKGLTEANRQGLEPQKLAGHTDLKTTEGYIRSRDLEAITPPSFPKLKRKS